MSSDELLLERDGPVALITVNRPAVLNALSFQILDVLRRMILDLQADSGVRAIIITGAGEKSFIAGADINELARQTPVTGSDVARRGQALFTLIETLGKPVIAAVNGYALGGGCELALACTIRLAAETAKFGQPEINLGIIPGYGGTQRLSRLVGAGRALELMLIGAPISAAEAFRIGLVNRVLPVPELLPAAKTLAGQLAAQPPIAIRYILEATHRGLGMTLADGLALEATLFGLVTATDDMREGTRAFLEKRKPAFSGS